MKRAIFIFFLLSVAGGLMLVTSHYFKDFSQTDLNKIKKSPTIKSIPLKQKPKFPSLNQFPESPQFLESIESKLKQRPSQKFISPDGRLKMELPGNWIEIKHKKKFLNLSPEKKVLLLAQKASFDKLAWLVISKDMVSSTAKFKDLVKKIKKTNQQKKIKMEIIKLNSDQRIFEALYKQTSRPTLHSKEKLLFLESQDKKKAFYLVTIISLDKDWLEIKKEADSILSSTMLK